MSEVSEHPIVVFQDRYGGAYSGGAWLAIASASELVDGTNTRAQFCLIGGDGPSGGDVEAATFWRDPPVWIAVGKTPEDAIKTMQARIGMDPGQNARPLKRGLKVFRTTST